MVVQIITIKLYDYFRNTIINDGSWIDILKIDDKMDGILMICM